MEVGFCSMSQQGTELQQLEIIMLPLPDVAKAWLDENIGKLGNKEFENGK